MPRHPPPETSRALFAGPLPWSGGYYVSDSTPPPAIALIPGMARQSVIVQQTGAGKGSRTLDFNLGKVALCH